MIYLGLFITLFVPMICFFIALDHENKLAEWVKNRPAATAWVAKICALIGSVLMAIGGVLEIGRFGVLTPVGYYLVLFLIYFFLKFIDKRK